MRTLSILAVLAAVQIGSAWAIGEMNVARPGGAFATIEAQSAGSCERLCVEDTLCMAWSFQGNLCELKAVVPAPIARDGIISGISPRAPNSMRTQPALRNTTADGFLPDAAATAVVGAEARPIAAMAEYDVSDQLLGGLDGDEKRGARLGN
jgi:hypothetical protein